MKKSAVALLVFIGLAGFAFAGGNSDSKYVRKADHAFRKAKLDVALSFYLKALEVNPQDCYANFQAGSIYYLTDSVRMKALPYFENTIKFAPPKADDTIIEAYYYMGNCYILKKDYNAAIDAFHKYLVHLEDDKLDADIFKEVKRNMDICMQAPQLIQRSPDSASYIINGKYQPTYVKNLGSMINTPFPEYAEVLLNKDSTIIFTSRRPTSQKGRRDFPSGSYYEDIFISTKDKKGKWTPPALFSDQLHIKASRLNLASVCISSDAKTLYVYSKGSIYVSHKVAGDWSKVEKVGKHIKGFRKYVPSVFLSYDGKELLLVSEKKGGYGGRDLYMSTLSDKGMWSEPQNLGPDINSAFDEDAPFLLPDNKTLFFSSKGHNGIGGYDVFKSVYNNGVWSLPVNLGIPVNSSGDDIFFAYDAALKEGFLSSNRINEGYGDMDLYSVRFTCDNIDNTMLQGKIMAYNGKNVPSATIDLMDAAMQKISTAQSDADGKYSLQLQPDTKYSVKISVPGYLPSVTAITTPHQCDPYNLYQVIALHYINADSLHKGQTLVAENAFYHENKPGYKNAKNDPSLGALMASFNEPNDVWLKDTSFSVNYTQAQIDSLNPNAKVIATNNNNALVANSAQQKTNTTAALFKVSRLLFEVSRSEIEKAYYPTLDSVAIVMKANGKVKLQITGYTDNTGLEQHNLTLSLARAKAVEEYLIKKNVNASDIHIEGKGIENPVAPNDGFHNYLNRRVEITFIQ
jgi:outer membrane protein OmpA-like peptidoglycan-associated protein